MKESPILSKNVEQHFCRVTSEVFSWLSLSIFPLKNLAETSTFSSCFQTDSEATKIVNENISASVAVNRFRFKKIESIVLCCLWTLLSDRLHKGSLDKVIKITLSDLNMELEKYDFKKTFDKRPLNEILKLFCKFNLIGTSGEIGDEDFTIILYPSLQFALNESEFVSFVKDAEKRMKGIEDEIQEIDETEDSEIDSFDIGFDAGDEN